MPSRISGAVQIAAVYVGTVVGAGFATGREIVEFFTKNGFYGLVGILLAGLLFVFLGTKIMLLAVRINAHSYQELNTYLFGRTWSLSINIIFFLMLVAVNGVMLSGAGSLFEEQIGLSKMTGVAITVGLALFILYRGVKGLFAVNLVVVPAMVLFTLLIFVHGTGRPTFVADILYIPDDVSIWSSLVSPVLYVGFNLALSQAVLVPVASEIRDVRVIKFGGVLGGICLTVILLTSHLSLVSLPDVMRFDIPTAELMKGVTKPLYMIYLFVIFGEIFTSLVGNAFGMEKQLRKYVSVHSIITIFVVLAGAYFISYLPYSQLLAFLYPLFGYIGVLFLFLLYRKKGID
ncbi:MAG: hypothetical protein ACI4XL_11930 [Bacillus sp. (in: firmicutes)]